MERASSPERRGYSEAHRERVESLLAIDPDVEQPVEEIEAGDPASDPDPKRERRRRKRPANRQPGGEWRQAYSRAQPEVTEPGRPLEIWVDDERRHRYRPQIANDRGQPKRRQNQQHKCREAEERRLPQLKAPARKLAPSRARVSRIDLAIDNPIDPHGQRAGADHGQRDPEKLLPTRKLLRRAIRK